MPVTERAGYIAQLRRRGATLEEVAAKLGMKKRDRKKSVARLDLETARAWTAVGNRGCETIDELCALTEGEILRELGVGRRTLNDIKQALAKIGRTLTPGDPPPRLPQPADRRLRRGSKIGITVDFADLRFFDGDDEVEVAWFDPDTATYAVRMEDGMEVTFDARGLRAKKPMDTWLTLRE